MSEFNDVKETGADTEVLIVGAGPTGLTLACDLARRGIHARLVEAADGLFPGSRGKGIQPRTLEVLDDLGIVDAVLRDGGPYPRMLLWEDGRPAGEHSMVERAEGPGVPYREVWMLPQWRTQELLYERLRALGGDVEFGARLTGLAQDGDGVIAHFAHAPSVRAAYLVAADGGRSAVRGALGVRMNGESLTEEPTLIADVRIEGLDALHWHVWPKAADGPLALCPLPGADVFQMAAMNARLPEGEADAPLARVRELVAARTHLDGEQVKEVLWASDFRASAALADRFREGRVFLAGDAAHIHSPAGGQGLNTSVQDAYNLGWKLGLVLRGHADPALLDTYEEERAPLAAGMLGLSTRLHRTGGTRRGHETHQLDLSYRDGSGDGPGDGLRAGDRAPDAECSLPDGGDRAPDAECSLPDGGDGTALRLFDAFRGPHFTLLALGGTEPPENLPPLVRPYEVPSAPGYPERALCLVRPDGYVALMTESPGDVDAYLRRLRSL
ncbi:FAD-dependent monooxygenase [Streptomyces sp. NPDC048172]|uniref:FAD-dependent monooxygenase n=1 Tax=Streptomyces sp. NPDC048172 TaxID=3365505 RepID=UPI00371E654B